MIINRIWAMPNKHTFEIKPIKELVTRYCEESKKRDDSYIIDPFANNCVIADYRNDLDPQYNTHTHLDGLEFLKQIETNSVTLVLWDPPYSPRQLKEAYNELKLSVTWQMTKSSYWAEQKDNIMRILKPNGCVITCGWQSNGVGMNRGFRLEELLLVPHGGLKHDTIVTVERKLNTLI